LWLRKVIEKKRSKTTKERERESEEGQSMRDGGRATVIWLRVAEKGQFKVRIIVSNATAQSNSSGAAILNVGGHLKVSPSLFSPRSLSLSRPFLSREPGKV
jgi:hypothetical protein